MTTPQDHEKIYELFRTACELQGEDRSAYLDRECAGTPAIRAEVEALLARDTQGGSLSREQGTHPDDTTVAGPGASAPPPASLLTLPGYEIVRELHRGGQGVVYQAIQKSTKRKVAIKVLLEGAFSSKSARRRFEREIELVAQLKHPNIISVFHSGTTDDGLQYCVMDYVHGMPLNNYIRKHKSTLEDALRLFATVCHAVNYAHQKGVIHRDLKPNNILVEADGNPKILDFGLAKQLAGPLETVVSLTGQVVGTLPYASPEQTRGNPEEIDIRTDVYSLGVVLYEILTGHYPYPVAGQLAEVLKHIAETPPTPPSRVWTTESGVTGSRARSFQPGKCPIDDALQTMVLKTLSKERERRYQSAGELALDIERYLAGEPIEAKRDSLGYVLFTRAKSFARRQPLLCCVLSLAAASILGLIVFDNPLLNRLNNSWDRFVMAMATRLSTAEALSDVRVVGLAPDTDIEGIARQEGLPNVNKANVQSFRRLHGRLMERLCAARPRCVVWDLYFRTPSPFDDDFLKGVQALADEGIPVVVATRQWPVGDQAVPAMSPKIARHPHVRWGCYLADLGEEQWNALVVNQRDQQDPGPSLAIAAVAATRHPGAAATLQFEPEARALEVRYYRNDPDLPQVKKYVASDRLQLSHTKIVDETEDYYNLMVGDALGVIKITVPPDPILNKSTLGYDQIFSAEPQDLKEALAGKVVLIADLTKEGKFDYPDGRNIFGCYAHAVAIDTFLLRINNPRILPRTSSRWLDKLICAALGVVTALAAGVHRKRRFGALIAWAAVFVLISIALAVLQQYLWHPFAPWLSLVLACELTAWVQRARLRSST